MDEDDYQMRLFYSSSPSSRKLIHARLLLPIFTTYAENARDMFGRENSAHFQTPASFATMTGMRRENAIRKGFDNPS